VLSCGLGSLDFESHTSIKTDLISGILTYKTVSLNISIRTNNIYYAH
jgi:hypothetical protein